MTVVEPGEVVVADLCIDDDAAFGSVFIGALYRGWIVGVEVTCNIRVGDDVE